MVEYSIEGRSLNYGICDRLANNALERLKDIWRVSVENNAEAGRAFGISNDEITVSDIVSGDKTSLGYEEQNRIANSIPRRFMDAGIVHTHHAADTGLHRLLSPQDIDLHLQLSDRIGNYTFTLVLTRKKTGTDADFILFGIHNRRDFSDFGRVQNEVLEEMNMYKQANNPKDIVLAVERIYDVIEDGVNFCYDEIKVGE